MLKSFLFTDTHIEKEALKIEMKILRERLARQQLLIREKGKSVLVLVEGWSATGKGALIERMVHALDARFFRVVPALSGEGGEYPFLRQFFLKAPQKGEFVFFDSGWMDALIREKRQSGLSGTALVQRLSSIRSFERQLVDDGCIVVKLFLHIRRSEQKKRLHALCQDERTAWRVSEYDQWQSSHYDAVLNDMNTFLHATHTPKSPWYIVDGTRGRDAECIALHLLTSAITRALNTTPPAEETTRRFVLQKLPLLQEVSLERSVDREQYRRQLTQYQRELRDLHNCLRQKRVPVILAYEGWDASGKGGNIRRVFNALDPCSCNVISVAAPLPHELAHHYLWRFWKNIPRAGDVAIFDRTWYGRVLVERVESLCTEPEWSRAYDEINEFERGLTDWGAILLKFWLHIDRDTQLVRFQARKEDPAKQWKITEEDWRNREKWEDYELAANEMLQKTSTDFAPWHIIPANDKRYARLAVLHIIVQAMRDAL